MAYRFKHEPESILTVHNDKNSVAAGWNRGIEAAQFEGCDYVLVINSDIIFKSNAIDRLVVFAVSHPEAVMWTMSEYADLFGLEKAPEDENFSEHPHFSCFMVKSDYFNIVLLGFPASLIVIFFLNLGHGEPVPAGLL